MIRTNYSADSITIQDLENNVLEIKAPNWSLSNNSFEIPEDIDDSIDISVNTLQLPESAVGIESSIFESWITDISSEESCSLPEGSHLIKIENHISTF